MYTRTFRYLVSESARKGYLPSYTSHPVPLRSVPRRNTSSSQQLVGIRRHIAQFSSDAAGNPSEPSESSSRDGKNTDPFTKPASDPDERCSVTHEPLATLPKGGIPSADSSNLEGEGQKGGETVINALPQFSQEESLFVSGIKGKADSDFGADLESSKSDRSVKIQPLPPLPPPIFGYPTPWVCQDDVERYLIPLYDRGWGVQFRIHAETPKSSVMTLEAQQFLKSHPDENSATAQKFRAAQLYVSYRFDEFYSAVAFMNDVVHITRTENVNHHPSLAIVNYGAPEVVVRTLTDSAIRPVWEDEEKDPISRKLRKLRGITLRDLRLAILIETLYTDVYIADGRGIDVKRWPRELRQRPHWDQLLKLLKKHSSPPVKLGIKPSLTVPQSPHPPTIPKHRCPACGGPHTLLQCTVRSDIRPPHVCRLCGDKHWVIDCPRRRSLRSRLGSPHKCKACGGTHFPGDCPVHTPPPYPCPNCGGDHWKVDCRQPQVPPDTAMALALPVP